MLQPAKAVRSLLQSLLFKLDWPKYFFYHFAAGLLVFHAKAQWSEAPIWNYCYYTWDGGLWIIAIFAIFKNNPYLIKTCFPFLIYATLRLCIYLITIFTKTDINGKLIVSILFIVALSSTIYLTLTETNREWNSNSGSP